MSNESVRRDLQKRLETVRHKYGLYGVIIQEARSRPEIASILIEPRFSVLGPAVREEVLSQIFPEPARSRTGRKPVVA
jgi:hypothetical protein